jgi:streptomycin 6-kinase
MTTRQFELPNPVRLRALAHGETGARWVHQLPDCVAKLERDWDVRVGEVLTGGSESLVVTAKRADATPAILKIGLPGSSDLTLEANILALADGRGYVRLLARDTARNAVLLERLGPAVGTLSLPVPRQIEMICAALSQAWIGLDSADALMTGAAKARWLSQFIGRLAQRLPHACAASTIRRALEFAGLREAAFDPAACVLVHGDCHEFNALLDPRDEGSCRFVDPDGLFAEPAYDLGILMRGWNDELLSGDTVRLGRQRCQRLATLTHVDAAAIWQWGFIERVSTGLHLMDLGMHEEAATTLAVAGQWTSVSI